MLELRDKIYSPIATALARDETNYATDVEVDFEGLIQKLVLSEEIVVESLFLTELPMIARKFGYDGAMALLKSGRVRFMTESVTTGNIGQFADRTNGPVLPLGSYSFSALRVSSPKSMVSDYLRKIDDVQGLRGKQAQK